MVKNLKLKWLAGATLLARGVQAGLVLMATLVATPASAAGAAAIRAGGDFNCVLTTAGGVQCWGVGGNGQLGTGLAISFSSKPVDVLGLTSGVSALATGDSTACVITAAGTVKCWGINSNGLLGNGTTASSNSPVDVPGVSGATAIAVGGAACAVLASGGVKCWGGALANGQATNSLFAVSIPGIANAVDIAVGSMHACARLTTGGIQCWGLGTSGQLGNGGTVNSTIRVDVVGVSDAATVVAGGSHVCYKSTTGAVKCWGLNSSMQLGNGGTTSSAVPVPVNGLGSGVASLAASGMANSSCVVLATGEVKC